MISGLHSSETHVYAPVIGCSASAPLDSNNFALAWQARRSLFLQTNQDFRYDKAAWLNYLTGQ